MRNLTLVEYKLAIIITFGLIVIACTVWASFYASDQYYKVVIFFAGIVNLVAGFIFSGMLTKYFNSFRQETKLSGLIIIVLGIMMMIVGFGALYVSLEVLDSNKQKVDIFGGLYFSVVTWTTLGYGDITPTGYAKLVASIEALFGYVMMALLVVRLIHYFDLHPPTNKGKTQTTSVDE